MNATSISGFFFLNVVVLLDSAIFRSRVSGTLELNGIRVFRSRLFCFGQRDHLRCIEIENWVNEFRNPRDGVLVRVTDKVDDHLRVTLDMSERFVFIAAFASVIFGSHLSTDTRFEIKYICTSSKNLDEQPNADKHRGFAVSIAKTREKIHTFRSYGLRSVLFESCTIRCRLRFYQVFSPATIKRSGSCSSFYEAARRCFIGLLYSSAGQRSGINRGLDGRTIGRRSRFRSRGTRGGRSGNELNATRARARSV